jgi:hypothetical protein
MRANFSGLLVRNCLAQKNGNKFAAGNTSPASDFINDGNQIGRDRNGNFFCAHN